MNSIVKPVLRASDVPKLCPAGAKEEGEMIRCIRNAFQCEFAQARALFQIALSKGYVLKSQNGTYEVKNVPKQQ